MALRHRILYGVLILVAIALVSFAFALSHDAACGIPDPLPADARRMQAIVYRCYGPPSVLKVEDIAKPVPADNEILVKVQAAAANPLDWHYMRGEPYVMRLSAGFGAPHDARVGVDFAGTVEAVGGGVTRYKPGDAVFGGRSGAFAEYITIREDRGVAIKPANVTFEQAAAVPVAAISALQGLRDKGQLNWGQKVLINGASGGVGTFAVQIAKSMGAEVTGVCSTRNVELVRSLGADHVIDYTREDFTTSGQRYDVILDNVGNRSFSDYRRVLRPSGRLVMVGGPSDDPWLGPLAGPIKAFFVSPFVSQDFIFFMSELNRNDLEFLADLMTSGKVTPVIDRRYPLSEVPAAIEYLEAGRARGKVIISIE